MSNGRLEAEEKMGGTGMPPLDMAKAVSPKPENPHNMQVVRKHSKRATNAYAELDPVGATLWRIDHIKGENNTHVHEI
jgi:hypothetical protein